jgi:nucleoredoxin
MNLKTFIDQDGDVNDESIKDSGVLCLYFSAHWCPPCNEFTPKLGEFYREINKECEHIQDKIIEIIFVSCDKTEE